MTHVQDIRLVVIGSNWGSFWKGKEPVRHISSVQMPVRRTVCRVLGFMEQAWSCYPAAAAGVEGNLDTGSSEASTRHLTV